MKRNTFTGGWWKSNLPTLVLVVLFITMNVFAWVGNPLYYVLSVSAFSLWTIVVVLQSNKT